MRPEISDVIGEPPPGVYTRRTIFRLAAGAGAAFGGAGLLTAVPSLAQAASGAAPGGPLHIFTWQGYDLTDALKPWRTEHKVKQTVKYLSNQFDVPALLKSPTGKQFDSSTANQAYTKLFQSFGIMDKITVQDVPSLADMFRYFKTSPIWQWGDGKSFNSVPWTWGALGINYNAQRVPKPTSYNVLIDPKNKGRVGTFDDAYNNVSVAAVALGLDLEHITHAQLNGPIKKWLMKLRANLKSFSPTAADQVNLLANKEVDYMQIGASLWSQLAAQQGAKFVKFTIPKEGGFGFTDAAFVTPWAPNKQNAFAWCEALIAPKTAGAIATNLTQASTNPKAVPYMDKVAKSLVPYGSADKYIKTKLKLAVNFTPKSGQDIVSFDEINKLWQQIKA
jgi:spermidine/putrescine transport system substrate-binding protein